MTGMLAATLGAMTPVLAQTTEPSPYSSYLFAFFSNNSPYGEQVRYALSDDITTRPSTKGVRSWPRTPSP